MKPLLLAILLSPLSLLGQTACETNITKGLSGGLFLTLQPGVAQTVSWDFSTCWFGIQNYTIYVTKPRACPSCTQHNLPSSTPLSLLAVNLTTGASTTCPGFICSMGTVSGDQVELNLLLDGKVKKPLEIEISTTAALGGP
jgi:hypothetical protein